MDSHMKYCPSCNSVKEREAFSKESKRKDGLQSKCKSCFQIYQRAHKYGISETQYRALLTHQQGLCAICHKDRDLVVDHNHDTGKVRGLLCHRCNTGLGHFEDSVEFIRAAEGYLIHD